MTHKLPFGLKENKLVSIDEVERGLACNCHCSNCGSKLIARKGSKKAHHFAHYNAPECNYAFESAIHRAAKEIIQKEKKILLPPIIETINLSKAVRRMEKEYGGYYYPEEDDFGINDFVQLFPEMILEVDDVILEKQFNDFRPDLILIKNGKKLLVEIKVTHGIDEEKLKKIKVAKVPVIEVSLRNLHYEEHVTYDDIREALITQMWNREWIYNPKKAKLIKQYREQAINNIKQNLIEQQKREKNKKQLEDFYKSFYKEVITRDTKTGKAKQVKPCELNKRNFQGSSYANIFADCVDCEYFRGFRNYQSTVVCLAEYHLSKKQSNYSDSNNSDKDTPSPLDISIKVR